MRGIDVSAYQGNIDWNQVKSSGVEFAVVKVIRKDLNPDNQFENNWNGAIGAGLPTPHVYNYSYATTPEKAISDAEKVVQILNGRKTFVWLDIEDECQRNLGQTLINIINMYKQVIEGAGCSFGVYTGLSFYESYIKPYAEYVSCPFWIARYPSTCSMAVTDNPDGSKTPQIAHELYGWQYSSAGSVPGISGNVDMDDFYKNFNEQAPVTVAPAIKKALEDLGQVDVYYKAYTDRWWPEVKNRDDWAGKNDNVGIKAIMARVSKGSIKIKVSPLNKDFYPFVDGYDENDRNNGYAGDCKNDIDMVQAIFYTPDGFAYQYLHYQVSVFGNPHYYSEQVDDSKSNGMDGYAGIPGHRIDKIQMWVSSVA